MSFVCEKCHERDLKPLKCDKPYDSHGDLVWLMCFMCGKIDYVRWCDRYQNLLYPEENAHGREKS